MKIYKNYADFLYSKSQSETSFKITFQQKTALERSISQQFVWLGVL